MATRKEILRQEAIKRLQEVVKPGSRLSFVRVAPSSYRVWLLRSASSCPLSAMRTYEQLT